MAQAFTQSVNVYTKTPTRSSAPKTSVSIKSMPHPRVNGEPVADVKGEERLLHSDVGLMSWMEGAVVFVVFEVLEDGGEGAQEELRPVVRKPLD